jgi:hypothetical protein
MSVCLAKAVQWGIQVMNLKEGMRRVGIVLGLLGACAGSVLAYADASSLLKTWREYKRFQALLATPTVRRATGADWIKKHSPGADKWCDVDPTVKQPPGYQLVDPCYETNSNDKGKLHWIEVKPWERDWSKQQLLRGQTVETVFRLESFDPDSNRDGVASIHYDTSGIVTSLQLATGEKIEQLQSPGLWTFFMPLVFPLVGFLLPWGITKSVAWVASGFIAAKKIIPYK